MSHLGFLDTLDRKVAPGNAALVVVDVQNDFCADDGVFGKTGSDLSMVREMMPRINKLIEGARSAGIPVIFVQAIYDEIYLPPPWHERNSRLGFEVKRCISGTWGADFFEVAPLDSDVVVQKHRYSAFVDTDLDLVLRSNNIQTVIVAGVATNICVESTSRDAFMRNYYVALVDDACAAYSREQHQSTLRNIEIGFGVVTTVKDLLDVWNVPAGNY